MLVSVITYALGWYDSCGPRALCLHLGDPDERTTFHNAEQWFDKGQLKLVRGGSRTASGAWEISCFLVRPGFVFRAPSGKAFDLLIFRSRVR